jgi:hypothetical protein
MVQLRTADGSPVDDENPLPVKLPTAVPEGWVFVEVVNQAITAGTAVLVATPNAGRRFRLMGFHLSASGAAALFRVGTTAANSVEKLRAGVAGANVPAVSPPGMEVVGCPLGVTGDSLWLDLSASATANGLVMLKEEST